jgi:hypothetical protein
MNEYHPMYIPALSNLLTLYSHLLDAQTCFGYGCVLLLEYVFSVCFYRLWA